MKHRSNGLHQLKALFLITTLALLLIGSPTSTHADNFDNFDDYSAFKSDPIEYDQEYRDFFGRFFQLNFLAGSGIFTGGLGKMNSAGFLGKFRVIYYFDKLWGIEIGAGWARHNSFLNTSNTGISGVDVALKTTLIPIELGIRYSFNAERLPRSISLMNPYLALNGVLMFRSEAVDGVSTNSNLPTGIKDAFATNSITNSTIFGAAIGGGLDFNVYRDVFFIGIDLRFNFLFLPDGNIVIGQVERTGNYASFLGSFTYNF